MGERISFAIEQIYCKFSERFGRQHRMYKYLDYLLDAEDGGFSPDMVDTGWKIAFEAILKNFGWNKRAILQLWSGFGSNWSHLQKTPEEELLSAEDWRAQFFGELHYCYDRWSLDRILRTHWIFLRWREARGD